MKSHAAGCSRKQSRRRTPRYHQQSSSFVAADAECSAVRRVSVGELRPPVGEWVVHGEMVRYPSSVPRGANSAASAPLPLKKVRA